jgi:hypothetical protein
MTDVLDLTFIGQRLDRLQGDIVAMREEGRVTSTMARRLDSVLIPILEELRAIHDVMARAGLRMEKLESASDQIIRQLGRIDDRLGRIEDAAP